MVDKSASYALCDTIGCVNEATTSEGWMELCDDHAAEVAQQLFEESRRAFEKATPPIFKSTGVNFRPDYTNDEDDMYDDIEGDDIVDYLKDQGYHFIFQSGWFDDDMFVVETGRPDWYMDETVKAVFEDIAAYEQIDVDELADRLRSDEDDVDDRVEQLIEDAEGAPAGRKIVDEVLGVAELLIEKNRKYGNSALNPVQVFTDSGPAEQIRVRLDDKLSRIESGQVDEDEDVVLDLIGYLVLLRVAEST